MTNTYRNRREILQVASLSGAALAASAAQAASAKGADEGDICNEEPTQRPRPGDEEMKQAKKELWDEFYRGALSWGGKSAEDIVFEDGLKEEKDQAHGNILMRKWALWQRCGNQTKHCAYMAGLLTEGIRRYEHPDHDSKFTRRQFETAVQMVQTYQRSRMGAQFIGIVC